MSDTAAQSRLALVTGATGYVGSNLTTELLERGWRVRTLFRSREKALSILWGDKIVAEGESAGAGQVEVCEGDATSAADLNEALKLADVSFYLIHSMSETGDFRSEEREIAQRFVRAAEAHDVGRIVFWVGCILPVRSCRSTWAPAWRWARFSQLISSHRGSAGRRGPR